MINKKILQERLANVEQGLEKTKNLFQQLAGQKALLEGLIQELEQEPREPSERDNS